MNDAVTWLALAGTAVVLVGSLAGFASSARAGMATQLIGLVVLGMAGGIALVSQSQVGAGFTSDLVLRLGVDPLSGFFLLVLALAGAPSVLYAHGWLGRAGSSRALSGLTGLFVLSLACVICARDVVTFLAGWELMTLLPAAAILVYRQDGQALRSVLVYLSMTHLAVVGVWVALLVLASEGALGDATGVSTTTQALVLVMALIGFGAKAGVMPLHSWLPRAHPAAPAHVSALMSGVMIKVAIYGLIRLVGWFDTVPVWFGLTLLVLGALSAVGGVTYALFQHDLKRLLAFHSIENIGIIVLGLAASYLFAARGHTEWASIALAAALLHTLNHALFKSLLFLGAGTFERAARSVDLEQLGGLLRRAPVTGWSFLVGAAAIAGVVPLNGFVSEWLTFQALVHGASDLRGGIGVAVAVAVAALAATAALALLCFVKVIGLTLLGPARSEAASTAVDGSPPMRTAVVTLAAQCVLFGVLPWITLSPLLRLTGSQHASYSNIAISVPGASLSMLVITAALIIPVVVLVRSRRQSAAPSSTWACGQQLDDSLLWTSAGFTKGLRLMLAPALRPQREISVSGSLGMVAQVAYRGAVPHLFDTVLMRPLANFATAVVRHMRRLQSGSLTIYVSYLVAVVAIIALLARVGALQ